MLTGDRVTERKEKGKNSWVGICKKKWKERASRKVPFPLLHTPAEGKKREEAVGTMAE